MRCMYGDLVSALSYSAALPVFLFKLWQEQGYTPLETAACTDPATTTIPLLICSLCAITLALTWFSWLKSSRCASWWALAANTASIAATVLGQWPVPGGLVVQVHFVWLQFVISANTLHELDRRAMMRLAVCLVVILEVRFSPFAKTMQLYIFVPCATVVFLLLDYGFSRLGEDKLRMQQAVLFCLVLYLVHVVATELILITENPEYHAEGAYNILKTALIASVGLVSSGAFRNAVDARTHLEREVAERTVEIRLQAEKLRVVTCALEASETAVAITDTDKRIEWWNPAFQRMTRGRQDLQNVVLHEAIPFTTDECDSENTPFLSFVAAGDHQFDDSNNTRRPIREVQVDYRVFTMEVSPSQNNRFMVVFKDVTDIRALQRATEQRQKEEIVTQALSDSIEVVSHELRTPLQGIMGITSVILDTYAGSLPGDAEESLSLVMVSSRLLLTLINNILDVRKCDASMMDALNLKPVRAADALQEAVSYCRPLGNLHNVTVAVVDTENDDITILTDVLRLQQVVINLLSNAIKHSPPGGKVVISTDAKPVEEAEALLQKAMVSVPRQDDTNTPGFSELAGSVLVVSVEDEGPGIDESQCQQLFRKFSQLQEPSSPGQESFSYASGKNPAGTGIGLNLCVKFIQRMRGAIWVENNPTNGASFSFYVPIPPNPDDPSRRLDRHGSDDDTPSSLQRELVTGSVQGILAPVKNIADVRVLVVDDILVNLKVLKRMLDRIGVKVASLALSGEEALEMLTEADFDLIISDIQMPNMSGTELSAVIRDSDHIVNKPVVVGLTAERSLSLDERCFKSGMAKVLHKPITTTELQSFFESLLAPAPD